jgi:thiamine-phosphate pyrophosphorylase
VTRARGSLLMVNDRIDVALAAEADGAHLPGRGLSAGAARRIAPELLLGVSTHSLPEARRAVMDGADFITFSPIWRTATHPQATPVGPAALAEVARALAVPVFALGGVDAETAGEVARAGARAACLRSVLSANDPAAAARAVWAALEAA